MPSVKRRTVSLDDETDRILSARGKEEGTISRAARKLIEEAQGNNRTLRHALCGSLATIQLNCRLTRQGIHTAGVLNFVTEIEVAAKGIELMLAKWEG